MVKYRISKYNPKFRNKHGKFEKESWTSYSDIGKYYEEKLFVIDEYLNMEDKYIKTLLWVMEEKKISNLQACNIEQSFPIDEIEAMLNGKGLCISDEHKNIMETLDERVLLKRNEISSVIKLVLRECIWCILKDELENFIVEFGYDFYMYFTCDEISQELIIKIQENNLFVEKI